MQITRALLAINFCLKLNIFHYFLNIIIIKFMKHVNIKSSNQNYINILNIINISIFNLLLEFCFAEIRNIFLIIIIFIY